MDKDTQTLKRVQNALKTDYANLGTWRLVGEKYGLGKAQVWRAAQERGCSSAVARAVLGETWITITVRCQANGAGSPANLMLPDFEVRRCPVTDDWFLVKCNSRQKYRADLSPAVKRAARRELWKCRVKFKNEGDWGKNGTVDLG